MRALVGMVVFGVSVARAEPIDLVKELQAIGSKVKPTPVPKLGSLRAATCTPVAKADAAAITKQVQAWIDHEHPDEKVLHETESSVHISLGCKDPSGYVAVAVGEDRKGTKKDSFALRRNYILKVFADKIDVVDESRTDATMNWMEWADEGHLSLTGQIDLDGDGALDLIVDHYEHEGGSPMGTDNLVVDFASGKTATLGSVHDMTDVGLVGDTLLMRGIDKEQVLELTCASVKAAAPAPCPGALAHARERAELINRFTQMSKDDLPDRDELADDLAILGVKPKPGLLAAAPETPPALRATRHVHAWADKSDLAHRSADPDGRAYLDDLAAKLGDAPCTQTKLTPAEEAAATAWVKKQDEKATNISVAAAACGPYLWAAWFGANADGKMREVMLARDGKTRILGFTWEAMGPQPPASMHDEQFFLHGGTLVGVAIGGGMDVDARNLWIIVDGKVVATSHGHIFFYTAGNGASAPSRDIIDDSGTLWHATPTGREKLDPALVKEHEQRRRAIDLVNGDASSAPAYLAALKLLGADAKLVAECAALK